MPEASWVLVVSLSILVIALLRARKTDYAIGCTRFRELGCENPSKGKCSFPDCDRSRNYRSKKLFIW